MLELVSFPGGGVDNWTSKGLVGRRRKGLGPVESRVANIRREQQRNMPGESGSFVPFNIKDYNLR
jgi:hypothetical protein